MFAEISVPFSLSLSKGNVVCFDRLSMNGTQDHMYSYLQNNTLGVLLGRTCNRMLRHVVPRNDKEVGLLADRAP